MIGGIAQRLLRCYGAWGLVLCLLCVPAGYAQENAQGDTLGADEALDEDLVREGFLGHVSKDEVQTFYFFRVTNDGKDVFLSLQEGMDGSSPMLTVPALVIRSAVEQMDAVAPRDAEHVERLGLEVQGETLWVRWAQRLNVFWVLAVGGLLGGAVMTFIVWLWLRRARAEQRRLVESRAHLAAGQEVERDRLAHELHDGPLQDLHGIRMRFGALRQAIPGRGAAPDESVPRAMNSAHDTEALEEDLVMVIAELRAIMADLHPPALTPFGLAAAIRAHLDRFQRRYPNLACRLVSDDETVALPEDVRLVLFRVCQEALSNAAKHAEADHIEVYLGVEEGRVVLRVSDDGKGFTEAERRHFPERGSFGLSNMAARAEAVGVDLRITSAPGQGTTIDVSAPLTPDDKRPQDRSPKALAERGTSEAAAQPFQTA